MGNISSRANLSIDKNGAIYYSRLADSPLKQWQSLVEVGKEEFYKINNQDSYSVSTIASNLIAQGRAEYAKEVRLINSIFQAGFAEEIELNEYPQFINTINSLIMEKPKYERLLNNLRTHAKGHERAHTAASFFESYLLQELQNSIINYIKYHGVELVTSDSDKFLQDMQTKIMRDNGIIDRAVKKASQMEESYEDEEAVKVWEDIQNLIGSSQSTIFKQEVYDRYKIGESLQNLWNQLSQGSLSITGKQGNKKRVKKGLSGDGLVFSKENQVRQVAGFIEEYFISAMSTKSGKDYTIQGKTMQGNMMKTDNVLLFSMDISLDSEKILSEFNLQTMGGQNLEESRQKIESFYNTTLQKLDSSFIVYQSAKNYGLGENFNGFSGDSGDINALERIGAQANSSIVQTVYKLFNTISGALMEDEHGAVNQELRNQMSELVAYFLFDDWNQIGVSNSNSIHLFNLDGVNIPLSYLLIGLGTAIQEVDKSPSSFFEVQLSYNRKIIYEIPITKEQIKEKGGSIYNFWNEQAETQANSFRYEVRFLRNFKGYLTQLINSINL